MTKELLYEAVGEIREEYIQEAKEGTMAEMNKADRSFGVDQDAGKRNRCHNSSWSKPAWRKSAWGKWVWNRGGTIAVGLCLVLVLGGIYFVSGNGGPDFKQPVPPIHMIEFGGAYYEQIPLTDTKTLDKFDLPHQITEDMVGESLGAGYAEDGERTEQIFYQYRPYEGAVTVTGDLAQERAQRAVYVLEEEGVYSYALFCNYLMFDDNTHAEASEMFTVYGIDEAADIAQLTIEGKRITDPQQISLVFDALWRSYAMGNEDYQKEIFGGKSEEEQQALGKVLADSAIDITMITTEGIVVSHMRYYPTIQYVSWRLNYYKLNRPIS